MKKFGSSVQITLATMHDEDFAEPPPEQSTEPKTQGEASQ